MHALPKENGCCQYLAEDIAAGYRIDHLEKEIVHGFSHRFRSGVVYVVMGRNGCGKSTLLKTLTGELPHAAGRLTFSCTSGRHALALEYIPQNYRQALFPWKTVRGNVQPWRSAAGVKNPHALDINQALSAVGLESLGYEYVFNLSGGQQQLVLIARCLVSSAQALILDEPLSALDVMRRARLSSLLRDYWKQSGRIVVCAMHEPDEVARLADEVLLFDGPPLTLVRTVDRRTQNREDEDAAEFRETLIQSIRELTAGGAHE
jgi:ABC-type nitrate/sulfonate/bicarbonate transport system ATPase subunit